MSARPRETVRLAYAILLPDDAHNAARRLAVDLYERLRPANDGLLIPPHVTLKQPFETRELARCEELLDRLAAESEPFDVVLRGFGTFMAEGVVFVDVEQDARLFALQRRLIDELGVEPAPYESGEPDPYHFHATLAYGLTPEQLDDARGRLAETFEFHFSLERLALFRFVADLGWIVYRRASARSP